MRYVSNFTQIIRETSYNPGDEINELVSTEGKTPGQVETEETELAGALAYLASQGRLTECPDEGELYTHTAP
ncbi:hypothetical protein ACSMXM_15610 [Pacificimonas sp. ICDLI1SI03]